MRLRPLASAARVNVTNCLHSGATRTSDAASSDQSDKSDPSDLSDVSDLSDPSDIPLRFSQESGPSSFVILISSFSFPLIPAKIHPATRIILMQTRHR